jgi:mRNA interferase RelE/StbE
MKTIIYTNVARKAVAFMPANVARLVQATIEQYAADPASLARNVVKLQGREGFRLQVGDWRVIFDEEGRALHILQIGPRGGIYE